jgi:hypothetical protein
LVWYRVAFANYTSTITVDPLPTKESLQEFVVRLRERGIRPVTCNTYIGAMSGVSLLRMTPPEWRVGFKRRGPVVSGRPCCDDTTR